MVLKKSLIKVVALGLVVSLVGCAGTLTLKDRNQVGAVRVLPPKDAPKATMYADKTSGAAIAAGASFGLIGGIVGGTIAAVSTSRGVKRFSSVTGPTVPYVATTLQARMDAAIRRSGKLPLASGNTPGGVVTFDRVAFGVAHAGHQRFSATISGEVQVLDPRGDEVWFRPIAAGSDSTFTLQEVQASPRVFQSAIDDATEHFVEIAIKQM